jgi:hypothetical protein
MSTAFCNGHPETAKSTKKFFKKNSISLVTLGFFVTPFLNPDFAAAKSQFLINFC